MLDRDRFPGAVAHQLHDQPLVNPGNRGGANGQRIALAHQLQHHHRIRRLVPANVARHPARITALDPVHPRHNHLRRIDRG